MNNNNMTKEKLDRLVVEAMAIVNSGDLDTDDKSHREVFCQIKQYVKDKGSDALDKYRFGEQVKVITNWF